MTRHNKQSTKHHVTSPSIVSVLDIILCGMLRSSAALLLRIFSAGLRKSFQLVSLLLYLMIYLCISRNAEQNNRVAAIG